MPLTEVLDIPVNALILQGDRSIPSPGVTI